MKRSPQWYKIEAKADDEAEVLIYDEIGASWFGGVSAEQFVKDIAQVSASVLNVRINSIGGSVFEGLAIYNALARHKAKVVVHVDGIAASIASIIALAGDEVHMADNAFMMIHNPHAVTWGNAKDMREMADMLDKVAGSLVDTYVKRTGNDAETVQAWMDEEKWFSATEARDAGFASAVTEPSGAKASIDLSRFRNAPAALAARATEPPPMESPAGPSPELLTLAASAARTLSETRL
jgi:ATP-dependent Clp protease, protease subunit